jgi:ABC-2 type transport system permease protein
MIERAVLRRNEVIRLVAVREIRERLRAKSFYVSTGLLVLVILAVGVVNRLTGDDGAETIDVGYVGVETPAIDAGFEQVAAASGREVSLSFFDDEPAARTAVHDGDVDVAVAGSELRAIFGDDVDDDVLALVQQAWGVVEVQARLESAGLDPAQIDQALSVRPLEPVTLDGDGGSSDLQILTGTMAAVLLYLSIQTFGTSVLTGVVEEKSTAVVEVLLVRARSDELLAGKVIGIGAAALLQFVAAVAAGMASLALSGAHVPGEVWAALPTTVFWFLGGYALYSTLFALAGSLVSRQEDAQAAAAPITYSLISAYALVFVVGYTPESTASTVMSLIPPIAPLLMPMRMAAGAASPVEVVSAAVLLLATTWATWKLAGRIYEQVLLRRGSRISWRDATALARGRSNDSGDRPQPSG